MPPLATGLLVGADAIFGCELSNGLLVNGFHSNYSLRAGKQLFMVLKVLEENRANWVQYWNNNIWVALRDSCSGVHP